MRNITFAENEFYHVYNRGVDKRIIFNNSSDIERFFDSMKEFNKIEPIGSLHENIYDKKKGREKEDGVLVRYVAYCLNPNHYHFILEQVAEKGIERFMHRLGTGYTKYFNTRYKRSGSLFQGRFKAIHIDSNEYLLHLSAYINLNSSIHTKTFGSSASKNSWDEYTTEGKSAFCTKGIILDQFSSKEDYRSFAKESEKDIIKRKELLRELEGDLEAQLPNV